MAIQTEQRHLCPRCGRTLAKEHGKGWIGFCLGWLFLRRYRCSTACGYRGIHFSRSQYLKRKKRLRLMLVIVIFFLSAGYTVKYVLARSGAERVVPVDEGIGEID